MFFFWVKVKFRWLFSKQVELALKKKFARLRIKITWVNYCFQGDCCLVTRLQTVTFKISAMQPSSLRRTKNSMPWVYFLVASFINCSKKFIAMDLTLPLSHLFSTPQGKKILFFIWLVFSSHATPSRCSCFQDNSGMMIYKQTWQPLISWYIAKWAT